MSFDSKANIVQMLEDATAALNGSAGEDLDTGIKRYRQAVFKLNYKLNKMHTSKKGVNVRFHLCCDLQVTGFTARFTIMTPACRSVASLCDGSFITARSFATSRHTYTSSANVYTSMISSQAMLTLSDHAGQRRMLPVRFGQRRCFAHVLLYESTLQTCRHLVLAADG